MKKWISIAAGLCVLGGVIAAILLLTGGSNDNNFYVYRFNPTARRLEAEARPLPTSGSAISEVINLLHSSGSTWPHAVAPVPEDLIHVIKIQDNMLLAFFEPVFYDIAPLEQTLFKAAFIYTMESLMSRMFPHVTDIMMLVTDDYNHAFETLMLSLTSEEDEDVPWLIYDGGDPIYNDPFLSRAFMAPFTFNHLHFVHESGLGLIVESHATEEVDHHQEERARYALMLLINNLRPEGAIFPIPTETIIHDVIITGDHILIDFSSDFANRFVGGQELARLMIYSIVNTLTAQFSHIHWVHFMIDARQVESFHGVEDFHLAFERDDTFLMSYILERESEEIWDDTE